MPDEVTGNHDRSEATGDEDSLLSHAKLAVGAVSSILPDFDLRRVGALPVEGALALLLQGTASVRPSALPLEEALALLLQGTASVCPSAFIDLILYLFQLC